jgi:hypothetical protein
MDSYMKEKYLLFIFPIFLFIFLQLSCQNPTSPSYNLTLTKLDVSCTETWLNLNVSDISLPASIIITKNGNSFLTLNLTVRDTVIYDNSLSPNKSYSYQVEYKGGLAIQKSELATVKTLDTTSNNYTWQKTVIGEFQSTLYDVWGTDENNVYATGTIILNGQSYGMLHYNGTQWQPIADAGGEAIYGFNKDDIWCAGGGVFHYDGTSWKELDRKSTNGQGIPLDTVLFNHSPYDAIWGSSSSDLFLASKRSQNKATIIHWNGSKAAVVLNKDLPYTFNFNDIYGTSDNNIWAVGVEGDSYNSDLAFHYDGTEWQEDISNPLQSFSTVFVPTPYLSLFGGIGVEIKKYNKWENMNCPEEYFIGKLRGNGVNDFFAVGDWGTVVHYNGVSWHYYKELYNSGGAQNFGVYETSNKVFIVGRNENGISANIIIGTKQ